jgi:hypothetical protein
MTHFYFDVLCRAKQKSEDGQRMRLAVDFVANEFGMMHDP